LNFAICYGSSAYSIAKTLGISKQQADQFLKNYFAKFKKLTILVVQAKNTLKKHYAIRTLFKRKRRFPKYAQARKEKDWKLISHIERQSVNSIVQGSAADLIKLQMRELHKELPKYDAHMRVQIHDEVIVECPKENAEKVLEVVKHTMEHAIPGVPLVAEGFISDYWKK